MRVILRTMLIVVAFSLVVSIFAAARGAEAESTASVVQAVPPVYPSVARAAHVSGEVIAEATVDGQGAVTSVSIVSGHKLLNGAAEKAASRWKFNSLEREAEERKIRITFQFTLIPSHKGTPDDLGVIFWPPYKVEVRDAPSRVD